MWTSWANCQWLTLRVRDALTSICTPLEPSVLRILLLVSLTLTSVLRRWTWPRFGRMIWWLTPSKLTFWVVWTLLVVEFWLTLTLDPFWSRLLCLCTSCLCPFTWLCLLFSCPVWIREIRLCLKIFWPFWLSFSLWFWLVVFSTLTGLPMHI